MKAKYILRIPEISKRVYDKFPITKGEKECTVEKATMDKLRANLAKKLYDEMPKEKLEFK